MQHIALCPRRAVPSHARKLCEDSPSRPHRLHVTISTKLIKKTLLVQSEIAVVEAAAPDRTLPRAKRA